LIKRGAFGVVLKFDRRTLQSKRASIHQDDVLTAAHFRWSDRCVYPLFPEGLRKRALSVTFFSLSPFVMVAHKDGRQFGIPIAIVPAVPCE